MYAIYLELPAEKEDFSMRISAAVGNQGGYVLEWNFYSV